MDINNRIVTTWQARAGNVLSVLGQVENSMLRGGRAAGYQSRQLGAMEQQMRALGTTIRYALAGGVIFGITGLVGKLNQLQQQLGMIAAIGPTAGINFGSGIGGFLNQIEQQAVNARTPVNELNNSVINFLSTVQGAPKGEIAEIVGRIGITSKLSQTPVEDLTKAVTTMNIAFGRPNNLKTINALLREWFHLISSAPGGIAAAPQIAQQLGPLAAVSGRLGGRMTPEQMMGVTLGTLRFGATPSTALRGAQYLLQSLFQPKSKEAITSLNAAGFTPRRLQAQGGARFLLDYLNYVKNLGARPTRAQARLYGNQVDVNPDTEAALAPNENVPGLSPQASRFLGRSIGRIHGIRAAITLLAQMEATGQVSSVAEMMTAFDRINKGMGKDAKELNKAIDRYQNATPLQAAAIGLNTLSTQLQTTIAPAINPVAQGIGRLSEYAAKHPHGTKVAMGGAAAFLAALGVGRFLGRGGSIFDRLRGFRGGAGQAFVTGQAIESLAQGGTTLGASPTNPMYTIIVGQLFGNRQTKNVPGPDQMRKPGGAYGTGGTRTVPPEEGGAKFKAPGMKGFGALGAAVVIDQLTGGHAMTAVTNAITSAGGFLGLGRGPNKKTSPLWTALNQRIKSGGDISTEEFRAWAAGPPKGEKILEAMQQANTPLGRKRRQDQADKAMQEINRMLSTTFKSFAAPATTEVTGGVDLAIKLDDGSGKSKDARVHIPLSTVHKSGSIPMARGKRKSMRVDFSVGGTNIRVGGKP